ncbi:MAG: sodium:solute symporter family protein [Firmicutes bacterium]|nr:sodium:solute symporter family protein [Bacillota bacterium]
MYATVFSTWMSVFAFMGAIAYFYEQGPIYMTTIGWDAMFAVLFIAVGRRLWHYGKTYNYMTPTDFFNDIYDSKVLDILVTTIIIVYTMIYLQVQTVGGLLVMQIATGGVISWHVAGIVFFLILVIYLWAGGLRAVALTDIFYGILIVTTILVSGFFLMKTAGGTDEVFNELIRRDPLNVSMGTEDGGLRVAMWLSLFVIVPIGAFMGPQMWIRNYAAASEKNFNILPLLLCVSSIICIGTLFAGSAGTVLAENVTNPDAILIEMIQKYASPLLYIFVIVGIYATIFSTANSQIHALSAVYTIDVHKRYINPKTPDKKLVTIAKWGVLFISAASYIMIILIPKSIFDLAIMALGGMGQLFIPVIGALFWKKSTAKAAIAGLLTGEAVFLICVVLKIAETSICAVAALLLNMFVFIIVSIVDKHRITVSKKIETYKKEYIRRDY